MFLSLDVTGQSTYIVPDIPFEILDEIIEEACATLDAESVSTIALTSHTLRNHANKTRFASIYLKYLPFDDNRIMSRIRELADIMRSGNKIDSMPGIGAFVTSFLLRYHLGHSEDIMPALDDGSLSYILDSLFRPCPMYTSRASVTRSLTLDIYFGTRMDNVSGYARHLRWSWLDPELLTALTNLLRFSQVDRLSLQKMHAIPRDFLQGSKIKHLSLRDVAFSPSELFYARDGIEQPPNKDPVLLESLDIDQSLEDIVPILRTSDPSVPTLPGQVLFYLTELSIDVSNNEGLVQLNKILVNASALRSLFVRLWTAYYSDQHQTTAIHYAAVPHLKTISLQHNGGVSFSLIPNILPDEVLARLTEIQIGCPYVRLGSESTGSVPDSDVVDYIMGNKGGMTALDNHLTRPVFDSTQRIVILVEVECSADRILRKKMIHHFGTWRSCIEALFPLLLEKRKGSLEILIRWKEDTM